MTVVTVSPETSTAGTGTADADAADAADTRHARALAALRSAETRTGVRKQATAARAVQTVIVSPPGPRALRGGLTVGQSGEGSRVLPVHPHLASLLPDGGLRTGTTVAVRGSTSLLLTLLAEASRDGAWTVLVGYPAAGMAAAADAGCDLARTLVVPLPAGSGVDAPAVLAALIDGMDVVVVGPEVALLDHDRRRLTARARERATVLISALPALSASTQRGAGDGGWVGAHVVLEAVGGGWAGIDHGTGWLRRRTLRVRRTGRGDAARPLHLDVEVPVCRAAVDGAVLVGAEGSAVSAAAPDGDTSLRRGAEGRPRLGLVG
ncbi:hypothetical protein AB1046_03195 [Promicromonospora sp. Populi]|uniref:hypothetical protein n=1 Tax=Promicromonospora sp. Populi TaxID=3239420 RepID=UPI0034E1BBAC